MNVNAVQYFEFAQQIESNPGAFMGPLNRAFATMKPLEQLWWFRLADAYN